MPLSTGGEIELEAGGAYQVRSKAARMRENGVTGEALIAARCVNIVDRLFDVHDRSIDFAGVIGVSEISWACSSSEPWSVPGRQYEILTLRDSSVAMARRRELLYRR
jgi:hypothetical protein